MFSLLLNSRNQQRASIIFRYKITAHYLQYCPEVLLGHSSMTATGDSFAPSRRSLHSPLTISPTTYIRYFKVNITTILVAIHSKFEIYVSTGRFQCWHKWIKWKYPGVTYLNTFHTNVKMLCIYDFPTKKNLHLGEAQKFKPYHLKL